MATGIGPVVAAALVVASGGSWWPIAQTSLASADAKATAHINERFDGRFRRAITLPDDADPDAVNAQLRDGVLHISVQRRASAQPRRIAVH